MPQIENVAGQRWLYSLYLYRYHSSFFSFSFQSMMLWKVREKVLGGCCEVPSFLKRNNTVLINFYFLFIINFYFLFIIVFLNCYHYHYNEYHYRPYWYFFWFFLCDATNRFLSFIQLRIEHDYYPNYATYAINKKSITYIIKTIPIYHSKWQHKGDRTKHKHISRESFSLLCNDNHFLVFCNSAQLPVVTS